MKNPIYIFLGATIFLVSCNSQSMDSQVLLHRLKEYRTTKSIEYATTGQMVTAEVRDFMHQDFYTVANNPSPKIKILKDSFDYSEVVRETDSYYVKKYDNKCYKVRGNEIILGEITNGEIQYYTVKQEIQTGYLFAITDEGPLVLMEGMLNNYYILEKDVPVLLDRLERTGAKY